jgi:hypothetical protein
MPNATKYVDNVGGNNANSGNSAGAAYADIPTAVGAITGGGNIIYVKGGSNYTLTVAITITTPSGDATNGRNRIEGYTTTPGARDGRPVLTSATNSINLFELNGGPAGWDFIHLKGTHTAGTRGSFIAGVGVAGQNQIATEDCIIDGCKYLFDGTTRQAPVLAVLYTTAINCTTGVIANGGGTDIIDGCLFYGNSGIGYTAQNNSTTLVASNSVFSGGTKAISDGNVGSARTFGLSLVGCSFRGQSSSAIVQENAASSWTVLTDRNNVFWSIGGYCWSLLSAAAATLLRSGTSGGRNNFAGSLTSGYQNNFANGVNLVTLTADPFTNAAGGDFSLNTTAGGGALVRAAGFPGVYPGGTTTGYKDGGAAQHQDSGGGGGSPPAILRGNTYAFLG